MADVLALATDVSAPIKVAWILWCAWGLVQIGWYRRACIAVPVSQPAPRARLERHRVGPPRVPSDPASTLEPSAPGDVTAPASDATPPSEGAGSPLRLKRRPPPPG